MLMLDISHRIAILRDGIGQMKKQRNNTKNLIPVTLPRDIKYEYVYQALHVTFRQRWLRIIPPILIACIISYMDRVNIAFAMPGGMDEELGISRHHGRPGGWDLLYWLSVLQLAAKIAVHGSKEIYRLVAGRLAVISVLTDSSPASINCWCCVYQ